VNVVEFVTWRWRRRPLLIVQKLADAFEGLAALAFQEPPQAL
jgi:hypothetical protein